MAKRNSNKSWIATLLLFLFLGGMGIHRFYVGKIGTGLIYLIGIPIFFFLLAGSAVIAAALDSDEGMIIIALLAILFGLVYFIGFVVDFFLIILKKFKDSEGRPVVD